MKDIQLLEPNLTNYDLLHSNLHSFYGSVNSRYYRRIVGFGVRYLLLHSSLNLPDFRFHNAALFSGDQGFTRGTMTIFAFQLNFMRIAIALDTCQP